MPGDEGVGNMIPAIGERIGILRKALGISMETMEKMTRIRCTRLRRIEKGEKDPSVSELSVLAASLGTNMTLLLGEWDDSVERTLSDVSLHEIWRMLVRMPEEEKVRVMQYVLALRAALEAPDAEIEIAQAFQAT